MDKIKRTRVKSTASSSFLKMLGITVICILLIVIGYFVGSYFFKGINF